MVEIICNLNTSTRHQGADEEGTHHTVPRTHAAVGYWEGTHVLKSLGEYSGFLHHFSTSGSFQAPVSHVDKAPGEAKAYVAPLSTQENVRPGEEFPLYLTSSGTSYWLK